MSEKNDSIMNRCDKDDITNCNEQKSNLARTEKWIQTDWSGDLRDSTARPNDDGAKNFENNNIYGTNKGDTEEKIYEDENDKKYGFSEKHEMETGVEADGYCDGYMDGYGAGYEQRTGSNRHSGRCRGTKTLLKCSAPETITVPIATSTGTAFSAASLTIDTSQFCNPCIHFEFASNIVTIASVLNVDFQIFKQCEDQVVPIAVSPVWRYSSTLPITSSDTFAFSVCRCNDCREKCCSYSVRVTIMGVATAGVTSIKNMTLSAFVAEKECNN